MVGCSHAPRTRPARDVAAPLADGRCLFCEAAAVSAIISLAKAAGQSEANFVILVLVLYFSLSGLLIVVGFFYVRKNLQRWSRLRQPQRNAFRHTGPVARLDELKGSGRIYLEQTGEHNDSYSVGEFAKWLHAKYALDVRVLEPTGIDNSAWDPNRKQFVAEEMYDQLKRAHLDLSADPNSYLIAFTDTDLYSVRHLWQSTFTERDFRRDIYESDLDPARTPSGLKLSEPCVFFEYSSRLGFHPNVRAVDPGMQ